MGDGLKRAETRYPERVQVVGTKGSQKRRLPHSPTTGYHNKLGAAGAQTLLAYLPSQAPGSTQGFTYTYDDLVVQPGQTYWYWSVRKL